MPAVQVQQKTYASTTNGTSHSLVFDSGPVQNNLLIIFVTHDGTLNTAPSGYTEAASGSDFLWGRVYYKVAGAGESSTVTLTLTTSNPCAMVGLEYSGMLTSGVLDKTVVANAVGTGTTIVSGTTAATTQAREMVFVSAHMRMDVGGQSVTAWSNSFTIEAEAKTTGAADTNMLINVGSKNVSVTGTQQSTGTITTGGLGHDTAIVVTFDIADDPPVATVAWFRA